jgi:molecular chaperone DnaJ
LAAQREWFEKDYYKTLGVASSATDKEITRAYRKLAKQFHPDANPGDKKAEEKFKDVSSAYDVLGDAAKRKEYDEVRRMAASGMGFGGAGSGAGATGNPFGAGGPAGAGGGSFRFEDLGDLFGGLFGRGGGNKGATGARGTGPQRGDDLEAELHLSFLDAVNGVTTTVNVTSDAVCERCHGNGAEPGSVPTVCPTCKGRGVLDDNQGVFSFSRPCPTCGGSGRQIKDPCKVCRGTGVQRRSRQVKVRIPAGVNEGQHIRLKGRGGAGRNGAPAGDLYVTVHVAAHQLFGRKGDDLTLTVPLTYPELVFGATIRVPTLTTPVSLKVPAGTKSGRTLRVKGHGVPKEKKPGDLLVTVELADPSKLSPEEKKAVEALVDALDPSKVRKDLGVK